MGNSICSLSDIDITVEIQAKDDHQFKNKVSNTLDSQVLEEQSITAQEIPFQNNKDLNFLKTNLIASNSKLFDQPIPGNVGTHHTKQNQCMKYSTQRPSVFRISSSSEVSIGKLKANSQNQDVQHLYDLDKDKNDEIIQKRSRKASLQCKVQQQNNQHLQENHQNGPNQSSQEIMRQISDFILSQKTIFSPKKMKKQNFVKSKVGEIYKEYTVISKIGEGTYGKVYKVMKKENKQLRAIKIIKKSKMNKNELQKIMNEVDLLKSLDHPNIIKIYQLFCEKQCYSIITQYCQGGSLLKYIKQGKKFPQSAIKIIIKKLMNALAYLHEKSIAHRDIKLDNIVLVNSYQNTNDYDSLDIRLIDFGLSKVMTTKRIKDKQKIGTYTHMAPQVIDGLYSTKCDIWSSGIVLCNLAIGCNPFKGTTKQITFEYIKKSEMKIGSNFWKNNSLEFKDLIIRMLEKRMNYRISAKQVLNHPWLKDKKQEQEEFKIKVQNMAKKIYDSYRGNNLVSMVQSYIAYTNTTQAEVKQFAKIFLFLDQNNDGIIERKELETVFEKLHINFKQNQINYILKKIDENHSGNINFNEFVTILTDRSKSFEKRSLLSAFHYIDSDNSGYIDRNELKEALIAAGSTQINCILNQFDENQDQKISEQQFIRYLQENKFK